MKKYIIIVIAAVFIFCLWFLTRSDNKEGIIINANNQPAPAQNSGVVKEKIMNATLHTNKGDITIEFFDQQAPNTVANFLKLAKDGFYDGVKFHRVIKGFMIQVGDPLSKDNSKMALWGTGGPGYTFADEINPQSDLYTKTGYAKGIVAMANSGPNTNGSQFFIMTENYPLPPSYTIFGKVDSGQDVVDKIANVPTVEPGILDRPVSAVILQSISLK
jgi:cyclophilin family peptidyl-prolyl cis-trans isomerase